MATKNLGPSWEQLVTIAQEREPDPAMADVDDAELEHLVRVGAAELAAATCRWLEFVAELTVRGIWADQGFSTPGSWLAWAVSMGASTAREHVRVALSLAEWPQLHERFAAGEISYSKVRAITRYGDTDAEELLLRYADHADGAQLERVLRGFAHATREIDVRWAFERRQVTMTDLNDGCAELKLVGPVDMILRAKDVLDQHAETARREDRAAAKEAAQQDGTDPVEVDSIVAYRADVLVAAIEQAADELPADTSGADRHTLVWHLTADDEEEPEEVAQEPLVPVDVASRSGTRTRSMSPRALARLACQAGMVAVLHDADGGPEAISGRTRRVPPRLMRALRARDRRCRYPGCGNTRWVDAHHIQEVSDGGKTRLDNLVLLCVRHHHVVHDRDVTILHDGRGRMRFVLADGERLDPSPPLPGVSASAEARFPQAVDYADRDPSALQPTAYAPRIDLRACVEVLLQELDLLDEPWGGAAAA